MSLPRFAYLAPFTSAEALSLAGEDSLFVGAGTDLFVRMKERLCKPTRLIWLENIADLRGVTVSASGEVCIGAATTLTDLAEAVSGNPRLRGLRDAIHLTSSPLLRNTGTIGGNLCQETRCSYYNQPPIFRKRWPLCHKLGGDRCHVVKGSETCHAVYSGDLAGPFMALQATVTIASPRGSQKIDMEDFFTGSGLRPTVLASDEILTEIRIPNPPRSAGFSYQKLRLRDTIDFPILGISLYLELDGATEGSRCRDARLVLSAAGPLPLIIDAAGQALKGKVVTEKQAEEIGLLVRKMAKPVANTASSPAYRREMITVLIRRALVGALEQAGRDPS